MENSDSIIDNSNNRDDYAVSAKKNFQRIVLRNFEGKVPACKDRSNIYSPSEINNADVPQRIFYDIFKTRFLEGD